MHDEWNFQSTRPLRGETRRDGKRRSGTVFFNPLAPCGARQPRRQCRLFGTGFQSTRPLRGETTFFGVMILFVRIFNPLAPCGARPLVAGIKLLPPTFQSTRPLRGETPVFQKTALLWHFSIHSPLAGRDDRHFNGLGQHLGFQSTRPLRGETSQPQIDYDRLGFSIHSPLAGRDQSENDSQQRSRLFNPLAPCGARLGSETSAAGGGHFQSTRPLRGETHGPGQGPANQHVFNPLAPCGARPATGVATGAMLVFNPLAPCGARPFWVRWWFLLFPFSIHSPLAGRDSKQSRKLSAKDIRVAQSTFPQIRQEAPQEEKRAVPAGKPAYIWCEPTGNLVCAGGSQSKDQRLIRRKDG